MEIIVRDFQVTHQADIVLNETTAVIIQNLSVDCNTLQQQKRLKILSEKFSTCWIIAFSLAAKVTPLNQ